MSLRNRKVIGVGKGSWTPGIYSWGRQSGEGSEVRGLQGERKDTRDGERERTRERWVGEG